MKPTSVDWNFIIEDLRMPAASLLFAAILLGVSLWFYDQQRSGYEKYSANQASIHDEYDALVYRRRLIERYYQRYKEFQETGFVGRERRLDWIQTIRSAATGLDLPSVTYSLEPQLEVIRPVDSTSPGAEIQIFLSRLELELGLVHELDLLRFFKRLKSEAPGLMKVDRCRLSRQSDREQTLRAESNILASCSMMMFSVITSDISLAAVEAGP